MTCVRPSFARVFHCLQMREIAEIELAIQEGTEKIETLGEQGKVEESMREMQAIEALKSEKADKEVRNLS